MLAMKKGFDMKTKNKPELTVVTLDA